MKSKLGLTSLLFIVTTLLVKVSGLIRDMVIAYYFGDSFMADAYLAAYIIPNILFIFMIHGMKNTLVPNYLEAVEKNQGNYYFNRVLKVNTIVSLALAIMGASFASHFIALFYPNFSSEAKEIAVMVTVILMIALLFVGINAVIEAYFDADNRFSVSMVSQIIVTATSIISAFLYANKIGVYALAIGYLVGTILSLLFKLILLLPKKVIQWKAKLNKSEMKTFYKLFFPVALTAMIGQLNLAVDNIFAGYFKEGSVTYINYAKNLVHFPQSIFGVTIGTIIFPILAKASVKKDDALFKKGIEQGFSTMFFILFPTVLGMLFLMPNIIELLYQRGAFTQEATFQTVQVAYFYVGSVIFFSLNEVTSKALYSLKQGHLILRIGVISMLLNAFLNFVFTRWFGYIGIPLASSVLAICFAVFCYLVLVRYTGGIQISYLLKEYMKVIICAFLMLSILIALQPLLEDWNNVLFISFMAITGASVFYLGSFCLRVHSLHFLINHMFRINKSRNTSK